MPPTCTYAHVGLSTEWHSDRDRARWYVKLTWYDTIERSTRDLQRWEGFDAIPEQVLSEAITAYEVYSELGSRCITWGADVAS